MKEFIGLSSCPKCSKKQFKIISSEIKDQLTVEGKCESCGHKAKGTSVIFRDDTYYDTKEYLISYFLRSFYLSDNEDIYICPKCDEGFYIVRKKQKDNKTAMIGLCDSCGFTKKSYRLDKDTPTDREMMNFILNIEKAEIENPEDKKNSKNDFFESL